MHAIIHDPRKGVAFYCYSDINETDHGHPLSPGMSGTGKEAHNASPARHFRVDALDRVNGR